MTTSAVGRKENTEQTLIEYAAERRDDPWWDEVYQIIHRVLGKTKSSPELPEVPRTKPSVVKTELVTEPIVAARRLTRIMCECVVCTKGFPAKRSDAKYCSHKCQLRGNRRGLSFRAADL